MGQVKVAMKGIALEYARISLNNNPKITHPFLHNHAHFPVPYPNALSYVIYYHYEVNFEVFIINLDFIITALIAVVHRTTHEMSGISLTNLPLGLPHPASLTTNESLTVTVHCKHNNGCRGCLPRPINPPPPPPPPRFSPEPSASPLRRLGTLWHWLWGCPLYPPWGCCPQL